MATELISINQAKAQGVARVRLPKWAIPFDHLELGGLWHQMYSPFNKECNGRDPIQLPAWDINVDDPIYELTCP